jgi:putative tryptophan/tyrosine transport system substrate-binding protein
MRRREFITLFGSTAACPLATRAQQSAMPMIGWLSGGSPDTYVGRLSAFRPPRPPGVGVAFAMINGF